MTLPECLELMRKREEQYRDAMVKIADLCDRRDRRDLGDMARGVAKTYGLAPLPSDQEQAQGRTLAQIVARNVIEFLREHREQSFGAGDLRTALEPRPSLSTWFRATELLIKSSDVSFTGHGGVRRYQWSGRLEQTA